MEDTELDSDREHVSIEGVFLLQVGLRSKFEWIVCVVLWVARLHETIRQVLSGSKVNQKHLVGDTVQHPVSEMSVSVNDFLRVEVGQGLSTLLKPAEHSLSNYGFVRILLQLSILFAEILARDEIHDHDGARVVAALIAVN